MSEHYEHKSPERIQRDIERTRAEMGDTLYTIRQKLSPGQLLDEAIDYLKGSGLSQFSSNLGDTVKQNPVPVSLIGIGIAWLAMAGSRPPYTSSTWMTTARTYNRVGEAAGSVTAKAGQVMEGARARVGEARGRMGEMAHNAQERIGEARERIGEVAHSARHQVGEAADRVRYQTVRAKDTYHYLRTEQPLILGILGFALGAALGAGLPPTRQEDELLGEMRDDYVHRAKEAGAEALEQGKRMATAAAGAVKEQAAQEGLQSEDAEPQQRTRAAGAETPTQGKRVAAATADAAKEQTEREGVRPERAEPSRTTPTASRPTSEEEAMKQGFTS